MIDVDRKIGNIKIQVVATIKMIIRITTIITSNLTISTTMTNRSDTMLIKIGPEVKVITNLTQINSKSINTMITIMTNNTMTETDNILTNSGISHIINTPINSQ